MHTDFCRDSSAWLLAERDTCQDGRAVLLAACNLLGRVAANLECQALVAS